MKAAEEGDLKKHLKFTPKNLEETKMSLIFDQSFSQK